MSSQMISPHYLILHSEHEGDLQKPWIVYRCSHNSDRQDELFRGARADASAYLAAHWDDGLDKLPTKASSGWTAKHGGFEIEVDPLRLNITDQRDRNCGWVWHVTADGVNGGDTIEQRGHFPTADDAKRACEEWVRALLQKTLAAFIAPPTRGGPTEQFPDAPYCKSDQSCCDFCCGN